MAKSPIDIIAFMPSNSGIHEVPPFVLLKTPPVAPVM